MIGVGHGTVRSPPRIASDAARGEEVAGCPKFAVGVGSFHDFGVDGVVVWCGRWGVVLCFPGYRTCGDVSNPWDKVEGFKISKD